VTSAPGEDTATLTYHRASKITDKVSALFLTLEKVVRVGVDLAKQVIQVHAVAADGQVVTNRPLARDRFLGWCEKLPKGCLIAMEACSGAHHWARCLRAMGLDARLISAGFTAAYRMQGRTGKNDANDAAAICEAASRPRMRFVPVKTTEQQGLMTLHRLREGIKRDRTACINRIRGLLAEFGLVFPKSPQALRDGLDGVIESGSEAVGPNGLLGLKNASLHLSQLDTHLIECDRSIGLHAREDARVKAVAQLHGIGPISASALIACVGDFNVFKNASQFAAWLGLTPRQHSSGGVTRLGRITKRGDGYLRTLLIQGGKSAVMTSHKRHDAISRWAVQLKERVGWQKAAVAMASKNARIVWALLRRGGSFDAERQPTAHRLQPSLF
jgi:transposase